MYLLEYLVYHLRTYGSGRPFEMINDDDKQANAMIFVNGTWDRSMNIVEYNVTSHFLGARPIADWFGEPLSGLTILNSKPKSKTRRIRLKIFVETHAEYLLPVRLRHLSVNG
jgi:hypothetical protein